jgi:putative restriction endonuclease
MMTNLEIIQAFNKIKSWQNGSERAPHKPLLILLALGEIQRGNTQYIKYQDLEEKLKQLLLDFGSPRKSQRAQYPFIRLANDGIWGFNKPDLINAKVDQSPQFLVENEISAGFTKEISQSLSKDPALLREIALMALNRNFPESLHEDILSSVGLNLSMEQKRIRNAAFREQVLIAYGYECAVCGFSVRLANKNIALESAHIKWFEAKGPDNENNGLALCTLHHKLFDFGAYTISKDSIIHVSDLVNGNGAYEWLIKFHGKSIKLPQRKNYYPEPEYVEWHVNEVFKGMKREMN